MNERLNSGNEQLYERVARKVISDTLGIKKGDTVTVETWNNGLDFARSVVMQARRIGAVPILVLEDEASHLDAVKSMPKDVLGTMGKHEFGLVAATNAYVFIPGPPLNSYFPKTTRQEYNESTRYNSSWYEAAEKARLRGARLTFGYVGKDFAKLLHKKPEDVIKHQLKAALADSKTVSANGRHTAQFLTDGAPTVIRSDGKTTIEFSLKGDLTIEDGIVDEGDLTTSDNVAYIPAGFVSKQVDPATATGTVKLSPSVSRLGIVKDAVLNFEGGRLVRWSSRRSPRILEALISPLMPEQRSLSAVTIGINPLMKYGYGQDRFVAGSIGLTGFGFTGIVRKGTISASGNLLVDKGKLRVPASAF